MTLQEGLHHKVQANSSGILAVPTERGSRLPLLLPDEDDYERQRTRAAREHLWDVARSVYGAGAALCEAWAGKACAALSEGRLDDVLAALRKHDGNDEARRCAGYVEANRARMRYPAFRAAGLPVGSGEVESSCGTVAGRLRRGGMRWSVDGGANPILTLRCWWLDGRYDGFFTARARPPPMALAA